MSDRNTRSEVKQIVICMILNTAFVNFSVLHKKAIPHNSIYSYIKTLGPSTVPARFPMSIRWLQILPLIFQYVYFLFSKHGGSNVIVVILIGLFVIFDFMRYHGDLLCGIFQSALRDFEDIRAGGPIHNRVDGRIHNVRDRGRQLGPHRRAFPMDKPRVHISVLYPLPSNQVSKTHELYH